MIYDNMIKFTISIHALREESDARVLLYNDKFKIFQSTLSVRRATTVDVVTSPRVFISIHALREESDPPPRAMEVCMLYFNPRSP